jgi:hypothetical protein
MQCKMWVVSKIVRKEREEKWCMNIIVNKKITVEHNVCVACEKKRINSKECLLCIIYFICVYLQQCKN